MTVDLKKLTSLAETIKSKQRPRPEPGNKAWYSIKAQADTTEVFIYDDIGAWGVTASDFVAAWGGITTSNITLRINSHGGSVFEATAIYNAVKNSPAFVTGVVDGIAASAASFILMAADKVEMEKMSRLMIHDAGIGAIYIEGNARQVRESIKEVEELANLLDDLSNMIAQVYVDKAGGTVEEWRSLMSSDKWYSAEQALEVGLADSIVGSDTEEASAKSSIKNSKTSQPTTEWDVEGLFNVLKGTFA